MKDYKAYLKYDIEAGVWFVERSNIPGPHIEAESLEELRAELSNVIPFLLADVINKNKNPPSNVPLELLYSEQTKIAIGC